MAYKCNSCGNISEEAGECCGASMVEESTEAPAETSQEEGASE